MILPIIKYLIVIKYNAIANILFRRKCYICNQNQRILIVYQKWR